MTITHVLKTATGATLAAALVLPTPVAATDAPPAAASTAPLPDWNAYVDQIRPIGDRLVAVSGFQDARSRQQLYQLIYSALAQGYLNYAAMDTRYPEFMPAYDVVMNLALPVPDYRYKVALVEGAGSYRISGTRGTSRFVDVTLFGSLFSLGKIGPVLGRFSLDDLKIGPDGRYEVILSAERPDGYTGDWIKLDPRTIRVQVRHASYDWNTEVDARMAIERLDTPAARPRPSAEEVSAKLAKLATWAENTVAFGFKNIDYNRQRGIVNRLEIHDYSSQGGYDPKVQTYYEGIYDLKDDEALIVETAIPATCRYWSLLVSDDMYGTVDWINHQSSLNGFQARLDADGKFRAVIAPRDPGVPNWLDTGGYNFGLTQLRWNECNEQPAPTARKVKLADVRKFLPRATPTVTPQQRDAALRLRREGAQLRSRW